MSVHYLKDNQHVFDRLQADVTCEKELGRWTVRLRGVYIASWWRKLTALEAAVKLQEAIKTLN